MTLDVFADIACPWCYIGEAHLDAALAERPGLAVERRWRPFQLQPGLPPEGLPREPFFTDKFGGPEAMRAAFAHVTEAGARAGLAFDFDRLSGAPNTADAHRTVLLAQAQGLGAEAARALFRAYFSEGRDVGDAAVLDEVARSVGVEGAAEMLASERLRAEVAAGQLEAQRLGVTGVPFVVLGGRLAVSGAQPPEAFAEAIRQAEALAEAGAA